MRKKQKSLFGSSRSSYFREKKRSHSFSYNRSQRVRFRSKYAGSVLKEWGMLSWRAAKLTVVLGVVIFAGMKAHRFWNDSQSIRVKEIQFHGDIPETLRASFQIKPGQNMVMINTSRLEKDWLAKLPQLKTLSVRRGFGQRVLVSGTYRTPRALFAKSPGEWALDDACRIFSVAEFTDQSKQGLPMIQAPESDLAGLMAALSTWKKDASKFYSLVKKIETDRMRQVTVDLSDGVSVKWGGLEQNSIIPRTKNLMRLRELFEPRKTPAGLRFVTDDRIVMDANWQSS